MNVLALIPARMGSSRFPGKPMKEILGKPMIGHVYENVVQSDVLTKTVVATCDKEIFDYIESIDGEAVMTGAHHERASDRCAEALLLLEQKYSMHFDIVVMVQGDEPMTHADMIDEAVLPMISNPSLEVVNLIAEIKTPEEFHDPNCIKVVCDLNGYALYFSRAPIPTHPQGDAGVLMQKQVCIIPFRRDFLIEYTGLSPTPLEIKESVDMMRVLEHGRKVFMVPTKHSTHAVDTLADLDKVEKLMSIN